MPKQVEFFRWWIVDERTGQRRLTTYKLSRAMAARQFCGAEPDPASREVRTVYEHGEAPSNSRPH